MNSESNTLSSVEYWDEVLKKANLPRLNSAKNYSYRVTMEFMDSILKDGRGKSMLEIGCGSSGWLPYFYKQYGLMVSGLDYSKIGCEVAAENLHLQGIPFGNIYCKDFMDKDFDLPQKFDFIFSYGVVEHFQDTSAIIGIFRKLLAPGGRIITLVPNLNGFNGFVTRYFMRDIYDLHVVMSNKNLVYYHLANKLEIIKSGYVGTFSVAVYPFANSTGWLFKNGSKRREWALKIQGLADMVLSKFFTVCKVNLPTRIFSPYIICIAENSGE